MFTKVMMITLASVVSACSMVENGDSQHLSVSNLTANCAQNGQPRIARTTKLNPIGGTNVGAGMFQMMDGNFTGNWYPVNDGDAIGINIQAVAGECLELVEASVYGNTNYTITMSVMAHDDAFHVSATLGQPATSTQHNSSQLLTVVPIATDNTDNNETVSTTPRSYFLQLRAHHYAMGEGKLYVGPIKLTTSLATQSP